MNITTLGSCRVDNIFGNNKINKDISYCHTARESINLIKYINRDLQLTDPYNILCFRTGILTGEPIVVSKDIQQKLNKTDLFIVEICSKKLYVHNDIILHHLAVDNRHKKYHTYTPKNILKEYIVYKQTDIEIYQDIQELLEIIDGKKLLITSHINARKNELLLDNRNELILLLQNICKDLSIPLYDPSKFLTKYDQKKILLNDLGHYTRFGKNLITKDIELFIKEKFNYAI